MSRSYRHIKGYEDEILKLKEEGYMKREIGERFGLSKDQIKWILRVYPKQISITKIE